MSAPKTFKPCANDVKRSRIQEHHDCVINGSQTFKASKPCPKCGGFFRTYTKHKKNGAFSSACNSCNRKRQYDADAVKKRRAIELHQEKIKDFDETFW